MNISFKNIPKFQIGGGVPTWYLNRYGNRTSLLNWNRDLPYNKSNQNLNLNDHRNAGSLQMVWDKNLAYTLNPAVITLDILSFYNSDGNGMSALDFENFYNNKADFINGFWNQNRLYGEDALNINQLYKKMFLNRSNQSPTRGSDYNIGYLNDLENILGSSTWLRRMDWYENPFDVNNPDSNRLHTITLSDGTKATYYKDEYGRIKLFNLGLATPTQTPIEKLWEDNYKQLLENADLISSLEDNYSKLAGYTKDKNGKWKIPDGTLKRGNEIPEGRKEGGYGFDWKALGEGLKKQFPNILETGRLIGNYYNNEKVYGELLKGIRPDLMLSYNTYRLVVGDEATKLAYYRRAAAGLTRAALPFTSDADKLMAYRFEAERAGNELKALGDLADNQRILETSELSAQHADANRLRATEVANANLKSINYANSLRHNLLALKHSANWTSFDNFLQGIGREVKLRLNKDKDLQDLIFALLELLDILDDPELLDLISNAEKIIKEHTNSSGVTDWKHSDILKALRDILKHKIEKTIESLKNKYRRNISIVKSGGKITHKKKDDLFYKLIKDSVEHFRKMSKMSSDALNRKRIKIEKLTPPPKTKKFLLGGVAPFTIYKPIILGEETTSSREYSTSSSSSKSSSSSDGKDSLDLVKKLFENLVGKGLPIDVNQIYVQMNNLILKSKVFGTELSTEDIASMYLSALLLVNTIQYYKTLHDKAKERVDAKNANYEWAIDPVTGKIAVLNKKTGEVGLRKFEDIDLEVENPLTNLNLLDLRSKSPNLAFDDLTISIVSNATSMEEIAKFLKSQVPTILSTETTLEGYTKKDTDLIKLGVRVLLDAPDGDYKYSETYKSNSAQINKALAYLYNVLPQNMKTLLKTKGDPKKLIETMLGAGEIFEHKYELDAATDGSSSSSSSSEDIEKIKSNPIMQMILELGGSPRNYPLITRDSNILLSVDGTSYSQIPKITKDTSVADMLATSGFQVVADSMYGITFGDLNISPEYLKDIMYPNDGAMIVTLPCKTVNGHKEVNLGVIDSYKEAVNDVESKGLSKNSPEYRLELGKALQEKGLSNLLTADGYPDRNKFSLFLVFSGYTTDKIKSLDTSSLFIEKVKNPDSTLEDRMIKALSTDDKKTNYDLDIDYWLYGDDVYRGTVFIPLNNNLNAAINAYGDLINVKNARELENNKLNFDKASNMKPSNSNILYGTKTE